jgi:hypothetical protein
LSFEANRGQTDSQVKFLSRGNGYDLYLTPAEAVLEWRNADGGMRIGENKNPKSKIQNPKSSVVRMKLVGANPAPQVTGLDELPGKSHYFIGNDPTRWRTNIPHYAKVRYEAVYPGIDLVYYGHQRQLEYDFVIAPGADPNAITLSFEGPDNIEVDAQGDLVLYAASGPIRQHRPIVYQEVDGVRQEISGSYVLKDTHQVRFQVGDYDVARPLVIDPVLVYSTFLGGNDKDLGNGIAVDADGHAYVTGRTRSLNFPTRNPSQPLFGGGDSDAFVAKLNPEGTMLLYSTYLGGSNRDHGREIAVDADGNASVAGFTVSTNFPTRNALQRNFGGGFDDAFVAKLNPEGSMLLYSTYLGGNDEDSARDIAMDAAGNIYVAGRTQSPNFPTRNALQRVYGGGDNDAFVAKLNPEGTMLLYSTYLGGSGSDEGRGMAVDEGGNAYVTGNTSSTNFPRANPIQPTFGGGTSDAFVAKLNPEGSMLLYSTYLGGRAGDIGEGIAVDADGRACVTGQTFSTNFPTVNPVQPAFGRGASDAFVAKLNPEGSARVYSTYLGGRGSESARAIAVDADGNAYVTGDTSSTNFPTVNPVQPAFGGINDAFVVKLDPEGSMFLYATYLGGGGDENSTQNIDEFSGGIAVDADGHVYVTGGTSGGTFPTVNAFQRFYGGGTADAFIAKIAP